MESTLASHGNPDFAAKVCGDLSPLFYFCTQKSWEMLENPQIITEVELWFKEADNQNEECHRMATWLHRKYRQKVRHIPCNENLIVMTSWLLLLLEQKKRENKHMQIHRLTARHIVYSERHIKVFRKRLLKVIDNPGKKVGALSLFNDETKSIIDEKLNNEYEETYIDDESTFLNEYDKVTRKQGSTIESFTYEKGISRLEAYKEGKFKKDCDDIRSYKKELKELDKKWQEGTISEDERKLRNDYLHMFFKGRIRYDYPRTDKARDNLRTGFGYFCKKMVEHEENPKFGSDFVKEGYQGGRACIWKGKGILKKKTFSSFDDVMNSFVELLETNPRRFLLEHALLRHANLTDLNLLNTFYEAGRQNDLFVDYNSPDALDKIYGAVKEKNVEAISGYLGEKNNLFQYLESGLEYYGII